MSKKIDELISKSKTNSKRKMPGYLKTTKGQQIHDLEQQKFFDDLTEQRKIKEAWVKRLTHKNRGVQSTNKNKKPNSNGKNSSTPQQRDLQLNSWKAQLVRHLGTLDMQQAQTVLDKNWGLEQQSQQSRLLINLYCTVDQLLSLVQYQQKSKEDIQAELEQLYGQLDEHQNQNRTQNLSQGQYKKLCYSYELLFQQIYNKQEDKALKLTQQIENKKMESCLTYAIKKCYFANEVTKPLQNKKRQLNGNLMFTEDIKFFSNFDRKDTAHIQKLMKCVKNLQEQKEEKQYTSLYLSKISQDFHKPFLKIHKLLNNANANNLQAKVQRSQEERKFVTCSLKAILNQKQVKDDKTVYCTQDIKDLIKQVNTKMKDKNTISQRCQTCQRNQATIKQIKNILQAKHLMKSYQSSQELPKIIKKLFSRIQQVSQIVISFSKKVELSSSKQCGNINDDQEQPPLDDIIQTLREIKNRRLEKEPFEDQKLSTIKKLSQITGKQSDCVTLPQLLDQVSQIVEDLNGKNRELSKQNRGIKQLKDKLEQKEQQIQSLRKGSKQQSGLKQTIRQKDEEIRLKQVKVKEAQDKQRTLAEQIQEKQAENATIRHEKELIQGQIRKKQIELSETLAQLRKEQQRVEEMGNKSQLEQAIKVLNVNCTRMEQQLKEKERLIETIQQKQKELISEHEILLLQIQTINNEKDHLTSQLDLQKEKKGNIQQENRTLKTQLQSKQQQMEQEETKTQCLSDKIKQEETKTRSLQDKIKQEETKTRSLQDKIKQLEQQMELKMKQNGSPKLGKLFVGDILDFEADHKKWLIDCLETRMKREIIRTKQIYRYDPLNKINFHEYIDRHPNLLVLIRTEGGKLLGSFSQGACVPNQISTQYGFLFSMTNRIVFEPKQDCKSYKAVTYDQYYYIFGNSELRIRTSESEVFSNFGIVNNYFDTQGNNVDILLGEGEKVRNGKISTYEFYEIQFQE